MHLRIQMDQDQKEPCNSGRLLESGRKGCLLLVSCLDSPVQGPAWFSCSGSLRPHLRLCRALFGELALLMMDMLDPLITDEHVGDERSTVSICRPASTAGTRIEPGSSLHWLTGSIAHVGDGHGPSTLLAHGGSVIWNP